MKIRLQSWMWLRQKSFGSILLQAIRIGYPAEAINFRGTCNAPRNIIQTVSNWIQHKSSATATMLRHMCVNGRYRFSRSAPIVWRWKMCACWCASIINIMCTHIATMKWIMMNFQLHRACFMRSRTHQSIRSGSAANAHNSHTSRSFGTFPYISCIEYGWLRIHIYEPTITMALFQFCSLECRNIFLWRKQNMHPRGTLKASFSYPEAATKCQSKHKTKKTQRIS